MRRGIGRNVVAIGAAVVALLAQSVGAFADQLTTTTATVPAASASVVATADTTTPSTPTTDTSAMDLAQAMTTPFPDVPANHWAYEAIAKLAADGYIKGYPDGTFKGQRPMTRYEAAYLVNQAVQGMADQIARGVKPLQTDIAALKALTATFAKEIADLQARVSKLESQTAAMQTQLTATKAEADQTAARLAGGHVGFRFFERPGSIYYNVGVVNGPAPLAGFNGAAPVVVPAGSQVPNYFTTTAANAASVAAGGAYGTTFAWGPGTNNRTVVGPVSHGTNIFYGAIYYSGSFGEGWQWSARIAQRIQTENASGLSAANPAFCTSTAAINGTPSSCSEGALVNSSSNIPVSLDYIWAGWASPGGVYTQFGRFTLSSYLYNVNPARWAGANVTGVDLGINDPNKTYAVWIAYMPPVLSNMSVANAQATGANAICTSNVVGLTIGTPVNSLDAACKNGQQEFASAGEYFFAPTRTAVGYEFDGWWNRNTAYWDPAAVACTPNSAASAVVAGSIATSAATCQSAGGTAATFATGGHIAPGAGVLGNLASGSYILANGPDAAYWVNVSQFWGCCHTLGQFNVDVEFGQRLGNDPFTGTSWQGNNMWQAAFTYASGGNLYGNSPNPLIPGTGTANSNVFMAYWEYAGLGVGANGFTFSGSVIPENNTPFSNAAGLQRFVIQADHWFNNNFRAGISFIHVNSNPNTTIMAGGTGCPGCFVNYVNMNQVYLDTFLYIN